MNIWVFFLIVLMFYFATYTADAQQNYVMCEAPVSGVRQAFPGTKCPSGWIFVGVVQ